MGLDVKNNPFLYSVGTQLAYKIAKRYYKNIDSLRYWSNQNMLYIDLNTLSDPQLQDGICTKIIIPQRLKKEIYEKIEIEASDLGL